MVALRLHGTQMNAAMANTSASLPPNSISSTTATVPSQRRVNWVDCCISDAIFNGEMFFVSLHFFRHRYLIFVYQTHWLPSPQSSQHSMLRVALTRFISDSCDRKCQQRRSSRLHHSCRQGRCKQHQIWCRGGRTGGYGRCAGLFFGSWVSMYANSNNKFLLWCLTKILWNCLFIQTNTL